MAIILNVLFFDVQLLAQIINWALFILLAYPIIKIDTFNDNSASLPTSVQADNAISCYLLAFQ